MPSEKRKAKKQAYFQAAKKSRKYEQGMVLKEGMKGFMITCNNREKEAVRESYNILNEFADKLFGVEDGVKKEETEAVDDDKRDEDVDDIDIDAALEKEKESLKAISEKKPSERRFQQVESGANNCIFIKTTLDSPDDIVEEIIKDIEKTQV